MARPAPVEVLHALLGTSAEQPIGGQLLLERLDSVGRPLRADQLLRMLLDLEATDHVSVGRDDGYSFSLTPTGASAAYAFGPGEAVDLTVLMVDLVGFVAFTERHGDDAGLRAAVAVEAACRDELTLRGGRVVKHLGDGVLGALPIEADPIDAVTAIARRFEHADDSAWTLRAAARLGRPIAHAGDLYGADVNLTARLCGLAAPDELILSGFPASASAEHVDVRGMADPVPIRRMALR